MKTIIQIILFLLAVNISAQNWQPIYNRVTPTNITYGLNFFKLNNKCYINSFDSVLEFNSLNIGENPSNVFMPISNPNSVFNIGPQFVYLTTTNDTTYGECIQTLPDQTQSTNQFNASYNDFTLQNRSWTGKYWIWATVDYVYVYDSAQVLLGQYDFTPMNYSNCNTYNMFTNTSNEQNTNNIPGYLIPLDSNTVAWMHVTFQSPYWGFAVDTISYFANLDTTFISNVVQSGNVYKAPVAAVNPNMLHIRSCTPNVTADTLTFCVQNYGTNVETILGHQVQPGNAEVVVFTMTGYAGINQEQSNIGLNVYPNPTVDYVAVTFESTNDQETVEVIDLNGRVISSQLVQCEYGQNQVRLDMVDYPFGTYIIRVGNASFKVIKH